MFYKNQYPRWHPTCFLTIFSFLSLFHFSAHAGDQAPVVSAADSISANSFLEASPPSDEKLWSLRFLAGQGVINTLAEIGAGDWDFVSGTSTYSLELQRLLVSDLFRLPIDLSAAASTVFHLSDQGPSNVFQGNLYLKTEWTRFWWDSYLRTRIGFGFGVSYLEEATQSEIARRGTDRSRQVLGYLDFSLSLNLKDLGHRTYLDRAFQSDLSFLDNTWLVFNITHRSGAGGFFGDYTDAEGISQPVKGTDNILMIGISHFF